LGSSHFFLRDDVTSGLTMQTGETKTSCGRNAWPERLSVKIPAVARRCIFCSTGRAPSKGTTIRGARTGAGFKAATAHLCAARPISRRIARPAPPGGASVCRHAAGKT